MTFRTLDDAGSLVGKTALVRVDFNVPMEGGRITDDTRLRVALPTILRLRDAGAKVALLAHFDRPKGQVVPSMSLRPVVQPLSELLGAPVRFAEDCVGGPARAAIKDLDAGGVVRLETVRFHAPEKAKDAKFATALAGLPHPHRDPSPREQKHECARTPRRHRRRHRGPGVGREIPAPGKDVERRTEPAADCRRRPASSRDGP